MTEGSHLLIALLRNLEKLIAKTIEPGTARHLHDRKVKSFSILTCVHSTDPNPTYVT